MMRYRMDFLCDIVYDILTCACFVCLLRLPLRPCSRSSCSSCLVVCIAELQVDAFDASLRGLAALSPWNGYNARLQPCSWRKWNVTARPACLICRLGPVIRADAAVTQQYGFDAGAWQQPWCWFKFKFRLSTRMSCPSNCHGTGTSKVVSWRSWPDTRFGCCGSPDRIPPTYVCMQGSALVVWPGMPFP